MSIFSTLAKPFRRSKGAQLSLTDPAGWEVINAIAAYTGKPVTEQTVLQLASTWTAIRLISETVGTLPLILYKLDEKGKQHATKHPLYRLLNVQPNPEMTSIDCWEAMAVSLCIYGQGYLIPTWMGPRIAGIVPISKTQVTPRYESGRIIYATTIDGKTRDLTRGEIIPIRGFGGGGLEGFPVYANHRNAIALAAAAEEYGARYFANGARPSGILTIEKVLTKEQREMVKTKFEGMHSGLENSNKIAVLEAGMKYQQVSNNASEAQLVEVRRHQIEEIARIWRIPLRMMMDPVGDTYNNNEQDNIRFLQNALRPYLRRIEKALETTLLSRKEQSEYQIRFDFSDLLQADSRGRSEYYRNMRMIGAMTLNEVREREGFPAVENGDDPHIPLNMAPADLFREILGGDGSTDSE